MDQPSFVVACLMDCPSNQPWDGSGIAEQQAIGSVVLGLGTFVLASGIDRVEK